jgi:hypothetical protein
MEAFKKTTSRVPRARPLSPAMRRRLAGGRSRDQVLRLADGAPAPTTARLRHGWRTVRLAGRSRPFRRIRHLDGMGRISRLDVSSNEASPTVLAVLVSTSTRTRAASRNASLRHPSMRLRPQREKHDDHDNRIRHDREM